MRIFNQIRKVLLKSGNLLDYLKYAIGEIILVVIGILIALQINNWNSDRKSNIERLRTLEILKQSFELNQQEIDETLKDYHNVLEIAELRIKHTGPNISNVRKNTIDSIRIIDIIRLDLANNLNSHILVDNKSTSLLHSDTRSLLLEYTTLYSKYKYAEENTSFLMQKLRDNHQMYISLLSEMAPENNMEVHDYNLHSTDYYAWLRDRDCQNISVEARWKTLKSIATLKELNQINQRVLQNLSDAIDSN